MVKYDIALPCLPDLDERSLGSQKSQVLVQWHFRGRDGADDEIQGARVLLVPVLFVFGGDVLVGAELESVFALVVAA